MDTLVPQIAQAFKATYGQKITDATDLLLMERNLLEFMMLLSRGVMKDLVQGMDSGCEGAVIEHEGRRYGFVDKIRGRYFCPRYGHDAGYSTVSNYYLCDRCDHNRMTARAYFERKPKRSGPESQVAARTDCRRVNRKESSRAFGSLVGEPLDGL